MKKLQDFARECGVTDRAVQKHMKTYAAELEGLYERKGPNGTWLTDEACAILQSKMRPPQTSLVDYKTLLENEELQQEVADLKARLDKKEALLTLAQEQVSDLQGKIRDNLALEATIASKDARISLLEADKKIMGQKVTLAEKNAENANTKLTEASEENDRLQKELEAEKNRKLTLTERLLGKKL